MLEKVVRSFHFKVTLIAILIVFFFFSLRQRHVSVISAIVSPHTCTPASRVSTLAASTLRTTCTFMSRPLDTH